MKSFLHLVTPNYEGKRKKIETHIKSVSFQIGKKREEWKVFITSHFLFRIFILFDTFFSFTFFIQLNKRNFSHYIFHNYNMITQENKRSFLSFNFFFQSNNSNNYSTFYSFYFFFFHFLWPNILLVSQCAWIFISSKLNHIYPPLNIIFFETCKIIIVYKLSHQVIKHLYI